MIRNHFSLLVLLAFLIPHVWAGEEPQSPERWDRTLCLHTEQKKEDGRGAIASGFFVRKSESIFLVTAAHASQETHSQTKILHRASDTGSRWILLGALTDTLANPWRSFGNSDLAIMRVTIPETSPPQDKEEIRRLAVELDCLVSEAPRRTTEIEITGFPLALGTTHPISPLVMKCHLASREMEADAKWGKEPILYGFPAVGSGWSGGPVFLVRENPSESPVVGMYIGYVYDQSGKQLSKMIPARVIREAIEKELKEMKASPSSSEAK